MRSDVASFLNSIIRELSLTLVILLYKKDNVILYHRLQYAIIYWGFSGGRRTLAGTSVT